MTSKCFYDRFTGQLLKCMLSWLSPGEYSYSSFRIRERFSLGFALQFWSIVLQCGVLFRDTFKFWFDFFFSLGDSFLTAGVFQYNIAQRRSVAILCKFKKIKSYPMLALYRTLPVPYVSVRVTHCAFGRSSVCLCSSSLQNLAVLQNFYSPLSIFECGTILVIFIRWCGTSWF